MSYEGFPDSLYFDEITAAIFKDGRQNGIWQNDPEVHQPVSDTSDTRLTKNHG